MFWQWKRLLTTGDRDRYERAAQLLTQAGIQFRRRESVTATGGGETRTYILFAAKRDLDRALRLLRQKAFTLPERRDPL